MGKGWQGMERWYLLYLMLICKDSAVAFTVLHQITCEFLVEQLDVYPNTVNKNGETFLFRATRNGHEAVVKVLLERQDINPNTRNKNVTRL